MPLREGCKKGDIAFNIRELVSSWESTGMINGDKIRSRKEALQRATAIALSKCPKKEEDKSDDDAIA